MPPTALELKELGDYSEFRSTVSQSVVALDIHSGSPDSFRGRLWAESTGDINVFEILADAHNVKRSPGLIERAPGGHVKFSLIEEGRGVIFQNGRETLLRPGDMAVYDTDRPYSLDFDEPVRMCVVMFPREYLSISADALTRCTAIRLNDDEGMSVGNSIRPYLSSLAQQIEHMDGHIARKLLRTTIDMVNTLLESRSTLVQPDPRGHLLLRIIDYIDEHLADSDLTLTKIAAAHFVSVRHLQGLFSEQGTSASKFIRHRRLERCYDELVDPTSGRSVTAIALGNGFVDAAHFSRTFHAHYGVTPSSLRPQARTGSSAMMKNLLAESLTGVIAH